MNPMNPVHQTWLVSYLAETGAVAGTVHLHRDGGLILTAAVNIPPPVVETVAFVARGKGMAGLALEQGKPIQTCNLKEDHSGKVKPGARAVDAKAAVALPIFDGSGTVRAVVGIAYADDRDLNEGDVQALTEAADSLPGE